MKLSFFFLFSVLAFYSCAQSSPQKTNDAGAKKVGGGCEGCEAIYTSPVPFEKLNWKDTLPDFYEQGPRLVISGTVYQNDGSTPAKDVVLYVYHTDQNGNYTNKNNEQGYAGRHGYIKGWIKTNDKGQYQFYTLRPASYPGSRIPAHIHPVIKEPGKNEYWIDEFLFDDDPFLTTEERQRQEGRGGSGVLRLQEKNGVFYAERNIYLGRKVPGYSQTKFRNAGPVLADISWFWLIAGKRS